MPLSANETADLLNAALQKSGKPVVTIPMAKFYRMSKMDRFKAARAEQIRQALSDEYGLIFAHGRNVVVVSQDRNFNL